MFFSRQVTCLVRDKDCGVNPEFPEKIHTEELMGNAFLQALDCEECQSVECGIFSNLPIELQ